MWLLDFFFSKATHFVSKCVIQKAGETLHFSLENFSVHPASYDVLLQFGQHNLRWCICSRWELSSQTFGVSLWSILQPLLLLLLLFFFFPYMELKLISSGFSRNWWLKLLRRYEQS